MCISEPSSFQGADVGKHRRAPRIMENRIQDVFNFWKLSDISLRANFMSLGVSSFSHSFSDALPVFLKHFLTPGQGAQDLWASDQQVINNLGLDTCLITCHRLHRKWL